MQVNRRIAVLILLLATLGMPGTVLASPAEDQYAVAAGLYSQGRWQLALEEFRKFVDDYPNDSKVPSARFYIGETLVQMRQFDEASAHFREFILSSGDDRLARKALFRAGEASYFGARLDAAQESLQQFNERYTGDKLNAYVLPYLGDIALDRNDTTTARRRYQAALDEFPQGPLEDDCRFGLGRAFELDKQIEAARQAYAVLAAKPKSPLRDQARLRVAAMDYFAHDYRKAAESYAAIEETLEAGPLKDRAQLGRGQSLYHLKQLDQARSSFEPLTDRPDIGVEATYWLALVEKEQGHWTVAAEKLSPLIEERDHPLAAAIMLLVGECHLQVGHPTEAATAFDELLENWPDGEYADDALLGKMRAALAAGDSDAVVQAAQDLDQRFPESPQRDQSRRFLARAKLTDKQFAESVALLAPLVEKPRDGATPADVASDRYLLAFAYEGAQQHDQALAMLEPLVKSENPPPDALRLQAAVLVAQRKFAEAVVPLKAFLDSKPTDDAQAQALAQLALCEAQVKNFDEAKAAFKRLIELAPTAEVVLPTTEALADLALAEGDRTWSAELYALLAKDGSASPFAAKGLAGQAFSLMRSGKNTEAATTFENLARRFPDDPLAPQAWLLKAQIHEREQLLPAAREAYEQIITQYPKSDVAAQALLGAARLEEQQKHPAEAVALYERLLQGYPQLKETDLALYNTAWLLKELGRADEATVRFEQLHHSNWKSRYWADAVYRLAERALEQNDRDKARSLLAELIAAKPNDQILAHALYLQAQCAVAAQQWTEVGPPLEMLLRDFPKDNLAPLAEFWLAESTYRRGDYGDAEQRFSRLAAQVKGQKEKWIAMISLRRAQIAVQQQRWTDARNEAEPILREYPGFEQQYEIDYVLGRVLASEGRFDDAREAYGRVIRSQLGGKTETAAMAQWMIGESYFHQKEFPVAIREYLRLEILYAYPTWQAAALLQAGKCHELLNEWTQATDMYSRLLRSYPSTSFTDEAARRLRTAREHVQTR